MRKVAAGDVTRQEEHVTRGPPRVHLHPAGLSLRARSHQHPQPPQGRPRFHFGDEKMEAQMGDGR